MKVIISFLIVAVASLSPFASAAAVAPFPDYINSIPNCSYLTFKCTSKSGSYEAFRDCYLKGAQDGCSW
jgi:hypothetical protein